MMALTAAEISAKVRALRRVVGTSSLSPFGGLRPVIFSQTTSTALVPANPASRLTPVPSSLMKKLTPVPLTGGKQRKQGFP
ncbi:hypothetical protein D9M68_1000480 [compost metagenome]